MISQTDTAQLTGWVHRLRHGDPAALNELLIHFERRLRLLTRAMLRDFPRVHRWDQTDDVYQKALLRLQRALREVSPQDTQAFLGLAALQIRRELWNLAKAYRHRVSPSWVGIDGNGRSEASCQPTSAAAEGPLALAEWTEFHEAAAALPEPERAVFDLLWYHDMRQEDAAEILGMCIGTVKKRWRTARRSIHEALDGALPGW